MRPLSMKRLFFCLLALSLVVTACNQASTARISATIEGAPNTAIVLEKLNCFIACFTKYDEHRYKKNGYQNLYHTT